MNGAERSPGVAKQAHQPRPKASKRRGASGSTQYGWCCAERQSFWPVVLQPVGIIVTARLGDLLRRSDFTRTEGLHMNGPHPDVIQLPLISLWTLLHVPIVFLVISTSCRPPVFYRGCALAALGWLGALFYVIHFRLEWFGPSF
jgi:hypothetical protein